MLCHSITKYAITLSGFHDLRAGRATYGQLFLIAYSLGQLLLSETLKYAGSSRPLLKKRSTSLIAIGFSAKHNQTWRQVGMGVIAFNAMCQLQA